MKGKLLLFFCMGVLILNHELFAQTKAENQVVKVSVVVQENPPSIQLQWPLNANAQYYRINRKEKEATGWGAAYATLPGTSTGFTDVNVEIGKGYEYQVYCNTGVGNPAGVSYVYSGIKLPTTEKRGTVLLLIDSVLSMYSEELRLLETDLIGDGWKVTGIFVPRSMSVADVKNLIVQQCNKNPDINTLFLLGRITVPYSGNLNPDAHPDHLGAWPADVLYADLDGTWTDNTVNNSSAAREENKNVAGDGKYDQSVLPSPVDLQCGRVDLYRMPQFPKADTSLIRQYLAKNHAFRHGRFNTVERGLIDDNFQSYDEGFAQTGWRNFSLMFGPDSIFTRDYFGTLSTDNYLWSYGCGGGSYTSCGGIGNTGNFISTPVKTVFTILFGSYFGDWDSDNNFLRAPLAAEGQALTCFWAGRPNWHIHHMAMGDCIGYSTKLTQNNTSLYATGYGAGWIHIALMGDPTLRMHVVSPPANLKADSIGNVTIRLSWTASSDPDVLGYNIYRAKTISGNFEKINNDLVAGTSFIDPLSDNGNNVYMVRAVKLQQSHSGTYYNMSQGIFDSASTLWPAGLPLHPSKVQAFSVFPNPAEGKISVYLKQNFEYEIDITISDLLGKTVYHTTENNNTPEIFKNIDLTGFSKGMYLVRISSGDFNSCQKIILK